MGNRIYLRSLFATVALATVTPSANANRLVTTAEGCQVVSTSDKPYSATWNGNCKGGLANGPGTVIWSLDGKEFGRVSGNYVDGRVLDGPEQIIRADGLRVESFNVKGESVRAVIHYRDGGTYNGEILDYKPNGQGVLRFPNGNEYTGSWQAGTMSGHGVLHYASGAKYEGEFSGGLFNGHGLLTYADGSVYNGNWIGGKRNGHGTLRNPDGSVYEGEFSNGEATAVQIVGAKQSVQPTTGDLTNQRVGNAQQAHSCLRIGQTDDGGAKVTNTCNRTLMVSWCGASGLNRCAEVEHPDTPTHKSYEKSSSTLAPGADLLLVGIGPGMYAVAACFTPDYPFIITNPINQTHFRTWCENFGSNSGVAAQAPAQSPSAQQQAPRNNCGFGGIGPNGQCAGYDPNASK
jgi:hypothetical protein